MRGNKKIISVILVLGLILNAIPISAYANVSDKSHWASEMFSSFEGKGYIVKTDESEFDESITRGYFITLLFNVMEIEMAEYEKAFTDVDKNNENALEIITLYKKGWIEGYPDGTFRPDDIINRYEAATIIFNLLELEESETDIFKDADDIPDWVKDKLNSLYKQGYFTGYPDGTFKGKREMALSEAVTFLYRSSDDLKSYANEKSKTKSSTVSSHSNHSSNDGNSGESDNPQTVDTLAPSIMSVTDAFIMITEISGWEATITTATDETDGNVPVSIAYSSDDVGSSVTDLNSARVHLSTVNNTITVTYNAVDNAGNTAVETAIFTSKDGVSGFNGRIYTTDEITVKASALNPPEQFDVKSIMPNHGTLGTYVTLKGQSFTEDFTDFKVYFEGSTQGKVEAQIVEYKDGEVVVISPVMETENYKVYVETENITSYKFDFVAESLSAQAVEGNARALINDTKDLIDSTVHEIQIAYTPEIENGLSEELLAGLETLKTDLDGLLAELDNANPDVLNIFNQLMATEALVKQKLDVDFATELLSHSTASESLDNINTALKTIKEVHSTLKTARSWMRSIGIAMIVTGTIGSIFSFGATSALAALGKSILTFCESVLTPVISTLTGIIFVLDCVPSYAVGDSFETSIVSDNYGINEGFSSLREILGERSSTNDLYETALKLRSSSIQVKSSIEALYNPIDAFGVDEDILVTIENDDALESLYADMKNAKEDADNLPDIMDMFTLITDIDSYLADVEIYIALIEIDPVNVYTNRDDYRYIFDDSNDIVRDLENISYGIKKSTRMVGTSIVPIYSRNLIQWADTVLDNQIADYEARNQLIENLYNENKDPNVFAQIEILPAEIMDTNAGVLYVGRNMQIKGTMDFEGDTNTGLVVDDATGAVTQSFNNPITSGIEFMIGGAINWFVEDIIGDVFDLDIDLTDVDVKLKLESEDESIVSGYWDGDKLIVTGHKPGIVKVMVIADIEQVTGPSATIPLQSASITRTYVVMSGTQIAPPFSLGPRIDSLTNLETLDTSPLSIDAYLGDTIKLEGYGFSNDITNNQNIYMPNVGDYNPTGIVEKRFVSAYGYEELEFEVPDTYDGDFHISVGEDQDSDPNYIAGKTFDSNKVSINIKNNELDLSPPSAIIGEVLRVTGKGFSHYGGNNKIEFLDQSDNNIRLGIANPVEQEDDIAGQITNTKDSINNFGGTINCDYHEELFFQVPDIKKDTVYDLGINTLNNRFLSNVKELVVRGFSENVTLDNSTLRADIAIDDDNSNMLAAYMDLSDDQGFMLMGAYADGLTGEFKEVNAISSNIGGIETAPDEPYVDYDSGTYGVVWVGKDNNSFDDIFVSFSDDGRDFSNEVNITGTNNVSTQPKIKMSDIDGDNDADALVVYTENGSSESQNTVVNLTVLENKGDSFTSRGTTVVSQNDACEPSLDIIDNHLVIAYSEAPSMGSGDAYQRIVKGYEADIDAAFMPANISRYDVSNKTGSANYYQDRANTTTELYATANNPDVAMFKEGNDYKTYYVWEQSASDVDSYYGISMFEPEDIYFAYHKNGVELIEPKNIADISRQSQDPKISVDDDGIISLAFINTGVTEQTYDPQGYRSYVYFTRSFNDGEEFGVPYMQLDNNGSRIGHLNLESCGSGNNTIIYQKHDSADVPTINIISTGDYSYGESNLTKKAENNKSKELNEYIARTYTDKTISEIPLVPYKWATGDIVISEVSGKNTRKIVRNNSTIGKISSTHDGKYIYYTQQWLVEAEADGSHPIRVSLGPWEQCYIGANISPNDKYVTVTGYGESLGTGGLMTIDLLTGYSVFKSVPYGVACDSMWAMDGLDDYDIASAPNSWWSSYGTKDFAFLMYTASADKGDVWPAVTTTGGAIAYLDTTASDEHDWDYLDFGKFDVSGDLMLRFKNSEQADETVDSNSRDIAFGNNSDLMAYVKTTDGKKELRLLNILDTNTKLNITSSGDLFSPMFVSNNDNLVFREYINGNIALKGVPVTNNESVAIGIGGNISVSTGVSGKPGLLTIEDVERQVVQIQTGDIAIEILSDMTDDTQVVSVDEGDEIAIGFSLEEKPDSMVYVTVKELSNDEFSVEGSFMDTDTWKMVYPVLTFDSSNYTLPQSFTLINNDDSKERGTIVGNIIFEVTTDGEIYDGVENQTIVLHAIDND